MCKKRRMVNAVVNDIMSQNCYWVVTSAIPSRPSAWAGGRLAIAQNSVVTLSA